MSDSEDDRLPDVPKAPRQKRFRFKTFAERVAEVSCAAKFRASQWGFTAPPWAHMCINYFLDGLTDLVAAEMFVLVVGSGNC